MIELEPSGYREAFPRLPHRYRSRRGERVRYLKATRDWYRRWCRSPMATQFGEVEFDLLRRLAPMVDSFLRADEPNPRLAAEIRKSEDRLGGSPLARQRLGWTIAPRRAERRP